jgi:hypothetical protein
MIFVKCGVLVEVKAIHPLSEREVVHLLNG